MTPQQIMDGLQLGDVPLVDLEESGALAAVLELRNPATQIDDNGAAMGEQLPLGGSDGR